MSSSSSKAKTAPKPAKAAVSSAPQSQRKPKAPVAQARVKATTPKAALARAGSTSVSTGMRWRTAHRGRSYGPHEVHMKTAWDGSTMHVRGIAYIGDIHASDNGISAGASMLEDFPNGVPLHPETISEKLARMSKLYGKFQCKEFSLHYVPTISPANTLANGAIVMAYMPDPDATFPTGERGVQAIIEWKPNSDTTNVYTGKSLRADLAAGGSQKSALFIHTEGAQRFETQGRFGVVALDDFLDGVSLQFGVLLVEYYFLLSEPTVAPDEGRTTVVTGLSTPGATGVNAFADGEWYGNATNVATLDYAASGSNLLLLPEPGFDDDFPTSDSEGSFAVWVVDAWYRAEGGAFFNGGGDSWVLVSGTPAPSSFPNALPFRSALPTIPSNLAGYLNARSEIEGSSTNNTVFAGEQFAGPPAKNTIAVRRTFSASDPVYLATTFPTYEAGGGSAAFEYYISFTRVISETAPRGSAGGDAPTLQLAMVQERMDYARPGTEAFWRKTLSEDIAACSSAVDRRELQTLQDAMFDDEMRRGAAPTTLVAGAFAPAMASAATYLIRTYGPKVAAHVLHWGLRRIARWARRH